MSAAAEVAERLVTIVSRLQTLDLWPPTEVAQTVIDSVRGALEVASQPPGPDPSELSAAASAWRRWGQHWMDAEEKITEVRLRSEPEGVWTGSGGDSYRRSMAALALRFNSVHVAAVTAEAAFDDCSAAVDAARNRYESGRGRLDNHMSISWSDLLPWQFVDHLREVVADISGGLQDMIDAYQDADTAQDACARTVRAAADRIDLPSDLGDSVSVVLQVNQFGGGSANDRGPLRGSTAHRAKDALASLPLSEQEAAQGLLDAASGPMARAWILAAIASGLGGDALGRYASQVDGMTVRQLTRLDPLAYSRTFTQPDNTTCGSSSLVMARMLNDPAYAMAIITGYDPRTGQSTPTTSISLRFDEQALEMHRQTNGWITHDGGFNGRWPEAWGTSPGSAARQMSGGEGLSGVPGASYYVQYVDHADRDQTFDAVLVAADNGHAVPIYTYDIDDSGASGAHVTLVVGTRGDALLVYEPGSGTTQEVSRDEYSTASLANDLGWDRPMAVVLPR